MVFFERLLSCLKEAVSPMWKSCLWLLRLMIPISLSVALLKYWGVIAWIAQYLNPVFCHIGLPGESAVIFVSGAVAGTYPGLAAMMSIPLTLRQASILGIMICLCHALPMECAVNSKTGSSFWKMAAIRIVMAFVCAFFLNRLLPPLPNPYIYIGAAEESGLADVLMTWAVSQLKVTILVFAIVYTLMVVQRLIECYKLLAPLSHFLSPLMTVFGLPRNAAYMWLVGNVLGISYGLAVMLDLEEKGIISREEADDVNHHLIMNHSMLEDTILFSVTGINALLIIGTRVTAAVAVVWVRRLCKKMFLRTTVHR